MAEDRYDGATEEGAEQNTLSACGNRTAKDNAELLITNLESIVRQFRARRPETPAIGEANPVRVCAIGRKTATDREEPVAMDKGVNRKDDSMRLPTLATETMAVGPESPRESQQEEGSGVRPRITDATIRGRNEQEPSKQIPENSAYGPLHPHETEEKDDSTEESWHDVNKEGCDMAYEEVEEGTRKRPDRGPNHTTF